MNEVAKNLEETIERIDKAAARAGRSADDVKVVAVSKTMSVERILMGLEAGLTTFGENKVQEFVDKYDQLKDSDIKWHFVGHLQSNKVKYIIEKTDLIHSLDRSSLAKELNKRADMQSISVDVLVEVNVAEEESKFGLCPNEVIPFIGEVTEEYPNLNIRGLMTMAPYVGDKEKIRPVFSRLRNLSERIEDERISGVNMDFLSMGMTNDFEIAVEEGSNMVRIGRAIFGERSS